MRAADHWATEADLSECDPYPPRTSEIADQGGSATSAADSDTPRAGGTARRPPTTRRPRDSEAASRAND